MDDNLLITLLAVAVLGAVWAAVTWSIIRRRETHLHPVAPVHRCRYCGFPYRVDSSMSIFPWEYCSEVCEISQLELMAAK